MDLKNSMLPRFVREVSAIAVSSSTEDGFDTYSRSSSTSTSTPYTVTIAAECRVLYEAQGE